ncbi:tetratricopeptide repeat protein [Gemmata sp.]|uniref:tetratricopeptide repeat protein n=1 Tax=Gemmata sp. TaxID=1914242 RepID=UPI003F72E3BE
MIHTRSRGPAALALFGFMALTGGLTSPARLGAQPTAEQQADVLLNVARKAYAEANPQFAAERFREFLQKFGGHKDAHSARLGLAVALLDLPDRNYQAALEAVTPAANDGAFPDRGLALYYAGACRRGLAQKELAEGAAKPNEMPQRQNNASGHFAEANKFFAAARDAFEKKTPPDAEWAARSRCDLAETELRLGKAKEARATVEPFAKDAALAKSKFRPLGLYYHGFAAVLLNDFPAAEKSLGQLAPFDQPFGLHARYLLGRVMSNDQKAEAAVAFQAVLTGYEEQKKAAAAALQQPDKFKNDPWEKARLEALVKNPAPDYVAGAAFYGACLNYEAGKVGEALPKFQAFAKEYAASPLKDDAQLRTGFCLVQSKAFDEAAKTLQPLTNHPKLSDQAHYWLGKAQLGLALATDPNNPNARTQAFNTAIATLRAAADRANQLGGQDPDAKARRPEILLELADALLTAGQPQPAAQVYDQILNEKLLPARTEETLQRAIAAYHLANDVNSSEARVAAFRQQFPNSALTPLALFRSAENAFRKAEEVKKQNNPAATKAAFAEAAKRYDEVVAKFPEFERAGRARYGLGLCLIAQEDWEKAAAALDAIPAPERTGDLAPVGYVLADCLIRLAPNKAEDALQDNILREKLTAAAGLLDAFVAANPKAPEAPDALIKFALCQKRLGTQLAPGNERNDAFNKARGALEKVTSDAAYNQSPLVGTAHLERAKVLALQGDKGNAVNALRQFANDPLQKSPVAPLAHVTLATLLREQNQAPQAVEALQQARQKFEGQLAGDPARAEWVALLRYHHGVALFEAGKPADARAAFDQAVQAANNKPIAAEAALKALQCQTEETKKKIAEIEKERAQPNLTAAQVAAVDNKVKAAKGELNTVAQQFLQRAEQYKQALPTSDARARMLYDAAWTARAADTDPAPAYTKLLAEFPDLAVSVEGRLELAELLAEKKPDDAIKLLKEAIDKEPTDKPTPPESLERVRIRLGGALFDKKDFPAAQGQFDSVANNEKSPHRGQALYRSAECLLAQGKADDAAKKLVIFRDNGAFHNVPGVSDRAVLRLGHAYLELKQWELARQAFEVVIARYGNNNPWAVDARYGMGLALQNQNRYPDAINTYVLITQATQDERAGRARLQIGECQAKQNKWKEAGDEFQTVYLVYDIPELKWTAMLEHARVLDAEKKPDAAVKLLERVVKDAPKDSEWTKAAAERLEKLTPKK